LPVELGIVDFDLLCKRQIVILIELVKESTVQIRKEPILIVKSIDTVLDMGADRMVFEEADLLLGGWL